MKIALIDSEYNEGASKIPNPWLMKLSSYFKQSGHKVSLVVRVTNPSSYDRIIIAKELRTQYFPPLSLVNNERTSLIGKAFRKHPKYWELPKQVYQARPDYNLYEFEFPSEHTEASFINLTYKGELLRGQSQARSKRAKSIHYIIDRDIWSSPHLGDILDAANEYNKIIFLEEIDIIFLKTTELIEKFAQLRFHTGQNKIKNIASVEELKQAIFSIKEIQKIKTIGFSNLKFITQSVELEPKEALQQYFNCIEAAKIASEASIFIEFLVPRDGVFEMGYLFQDFRYYHNKKDSFFTYLLRRTKLEPAAAMSNITQWYKEPVNMIWRLYHVNREVFENGFIKWGGFPDETRKQLNEGDAKQFYDLFIL